MDDLVQFVRDCLDEEAETARVTGNVMVTAGVDKLGLTVEAAERQVRLRAQELEAKRALFEETIRPYLGTAGPTGRIAEQQARLFAVMYASRPGYHGDWRP